MTNKSKRPTRKEVVASERRRRKPGGAVSTKLTVRDELKDDAFEYRWINDDGVRLTDMTVHDDWDIVTTDELSGELKGDGTGSQVDRIVGTDSARRPMKAYLCKKRKDYIKQDLQEEQASIDETEKMIKRGPIQSQEGLNQAEAYIPDSGIKIDAGGDYKP